MTVTELSQPRRSPGRRRPGSCSRAAGCPRRRPLFAAPAGLRLAALTEAVGDQLAGGRRGPGGARRPTTTAPNLHAGRGPCLARAWGSTDSITEPESESGPAGSVLITRAQPAVSVLTGVRLLRINPRDTNNSSYIGH